LLGKAKWGEEREEEREGRSSASSGGSDATDKGGKREKREGEKPSNHHRAPPNGATPIVWIFCPN
ncbi:hypothetical protein U1Q18_043528, partial [Sarracenia purpurea var. burkii]